MKKFLMFSVVVLCSVGLVSLATSASAPTGKITVSVSGKKPVQYDHPAHVERVQKDCQVCHHKDPKGQGSKCSTCHTETGKDGAGPGKETFHTQCGDCHKKSAKGPQYPKDCKTCHGA